MKFLKCIFKPEFSWFELLIFIALLAADVSFPVLIFVVFIVGMVTASVQIYFERKGDEL